MVVWSFVFPLRNICCMHGKYREGLDHQYLRTKGYCYSHRHFHCISKCLHTVCEYFGRYSLVQLRSSNTFYYYRIVGIHDLILFREHEIESAAALIVLLIADLIHTSGGFNALTINPPSILRAKKCHDPTDVFRFPCSAQRSDRSHVGFSFWTAS